MKRVLSAIMCALLVAVALLMDVQADETKTDEYKNKENNRYVVRPVNIGSQEYIEISGLGKVYFNVSIEGHYYPTLAEADITTTVTKIGHVITNTYYNSTNYVFYSSAVKKWVQTDFDNNGNLTISVRVEVTLFNETLGSFTAAQTFYYQP